ncbi:MAG: hypothetical protein WAP47_04015 [Candidatus Rokuibacteriota bacterium]
MVVDSVGTLIGNVLGFTFDGSQHVLPNVVLQRNGRAVGVVVTPNGFEGSGASLSYESLNCTGTPYLDGDFTTLILPATIEGPGHTVYVPDTSATPRPVAAQSLLMQGACFSWLSNLQSAVPAIPLVDLDTLYAPPFTVR